MSIASNLPLEVVRTSLIHSSPRVRLATFSALESVVPTFQKDGPNPYEGARAEAELWKGALPYSFKESGKEYTTRLLQSLSGFLARLSFAEADHYDDTSELPRPPGLPTLTSFVCDFLMGDIIMRKGAYPGTVADKEGFILPLVRCLLSFASSDGTGLAHETSSTRSKSAVGKKNVPRRKLTPSQIVAKSSIANALLSQELFASLLSLMNSMWDNTRALSFCATCDLAFFAHAHQMTLPTSITSQQSRAYMKARAFHLMSSPRQREADTGARLLAFLYATLPATQERTSYLTIVVEWVSDRLGMMETALCAILAGSNPIAPDSHSRETTDGRNLPLAHGFIHALRLIVDFRRLVPKPAAMSESSELFDTMVQLSCRAVELSLSVVADIEVDGLDDEENALATNSQIYPLRRRKKPAQDNISNSPSAPLNVNTGAIGANAAFASLKSKDDDETNQRLALQRVVVSIACRAGGRVGSHDVWLTR